MNSPDKSGLILPDIGKSLAAFQEWMMNRKKNSIQPFGQRLAQLRLTKGFTQGELAERIGVSQRVLCYYERETEYPPAHLLPKIAEILGASLDDLMDTTPLKTEAVSTHPRLHRKLRLVETFPRQDQKAILRMIDAFAARTVAANGKH